MKDNRRSVLPLIAALAMAVTQVASAQGQSPTSPRPRPGIPGLDSPFNGEAPREDSGMSRFSGGGRFSRPAAEEEAVEGQQVETEAGEESPGEQSTARPRPLPSGGGGPRAVESGASGTPGSGLITGSGPADAAVGGARWFRGADDGAADMGPSGMGMGVAAGMGAAFDPIFEREVVYPPLPEGGEVLIDLKGPSTVADFMEDIRIATLWNILIDESVRDKSIDYWITEATPQQAMEILKFHDLYYEFNAETGYFYVMSVEDWQRREFGKLEQRAFVLQHAANGSVEPIVAGLLSRAGRMYSDPRTRHIYVWDTPDNIGVMERAVEELDVPLQKREFAVAYADFGEVEAALSSMLSPAGSLLPSGRTNTFIAWDQPDVLERMGDALATLDVPVVSRTFYLDHVYASEVVDYLEILLSDHGIMQVDPRGNTIVVTDLRQRLERFASAIDELDRELETRTWVVDYADLEFLAEQIETRIPVEMGSIIVQEDVHQITVTGIPSRLEEIDRFIKVADVQRKQVQIEAFIVEVGTDVEREFNINWSYFGSRGDSPIFFDAGDGFNPESGNLNVGQLPYSVPLYGALELDAAGQIVRPIVTNIEGENVVSRIAGNDLAVTLEYLDRKNKATVLSSPRVAVQDGEEASFENATQVPFVSSTTFFSNNALNPIGNVNNTNRVEFIDVGTILRVLPRITTKDNILLDISAEDSTFVEVVVLASDERSTVPQKTVRRAETQLRIQSGDTVVLGGLRRDRAGVSEDRTPILGDLPGIGRLFRYPNRQSEKSSLLIFITPTIVDEFTDPQAALLADAESTIAEEHRYNQKNLWGRIAATVSQRDNEVMVAVGQNGDIHAEGERVTLEELREMFLEAPVNVRVVLRHHPRAPGAIVASVSELALETERAFELDNDLVPLVPRYRMGVEAGAEIAPSTPPDE